MFKPAITFALTLSLMGTLAACGGGEDLAGSNIDMPSEITFHEERVIGPIATGLDDSNAVVQ